MKNVIESFQISSKCAKFSRCKYLNSVWNLQLNKEKLILFHQLILTADKCSHEGKDYDIGEKFTNSACTALCTCMSGGQTRCVSLCPQSLPSCSMSSHLLVKNVPSADPAGRCKCQRRVCAPRLPAPAGTLCSLLLSPPCVLVYQSRSITMVPRSQNYLPYLYSVACFQA